jgi:histidinol-phosphatase (PHP family)
MPVVSKDKPVANRAGALYFDSHMHTPLCKHAWDTPEQYCQQALDAGLKGVIFTCHCPMPDGFWPAVRMEEHEFDKYLELVRDAQKTFRNKLEVGLGIESEYFPGYEKYIEDLHQRAPFDYCLGGLHWQAPEYRLRYEQGTIEGFRRLYFDHLATSAETGLYDCIAHPDLVKNYHPDSWCFAIIKGTVAQALDRIAKTGVAMELNTSGLNKSYHEMNPGNEMLAMMAERKIPVVLGSDAHRSLRVGDQFVTALNNLVQAGYQKVSYFKKRQRIDVKIKEVLSSIAKAAKTAVPAKA